MNVQEFLSGITPFDSLDDESLARAAAAVEIEFFPKGTEIIRAAGEPSSSLYVVRAGAVELVEDGRLIDLLSDGELFGFPSLLSGRRPDLTVRAHEDTICYAIQRDVAETVLGSPAGLSFVASRLRRTGSGEPESSLLSDGLVPVERLIRRQAIQCDPSTPVREAAATMSEHRVSSLLIRRGDELGILTDRDLRARVVAAGVDGGMPVAELATFPARTVSSDATVTEVLLAMLDGGIHHFPVLDRTGALVGVVTDTDLMGLARQSPFALRSEIERAAVPGDVAVAARGLPDVVAGLVDAGVDPVDVGRVTAIAIDTMTETLIRLATRDLGEAPVAWAWLALGSAARREQALRTDQDHAIVYEDTADSSAADRYFGEVGARVTEGLAAAGIPKCEGGVMAANPALRKSVQGWRKALDSWMEAPGIEGSQNTSIVFDYRRVAGTLDAEGVLDEAVSDARNRPLFMRHLAHRALDLRPPTGFFRHFVVGAKGEHAGRLDLKHRGIIIIGNLARIYAVRWGINEKSTLERLRAAAASGEVDETLTESLAEAFRLFWRLRLEHQAAQVRRGEPPDDFIDPAALTTVTRGGLRAAFRSVGHAQRLLATELGVRPP
ncbi:MAG TPA: putative nucleotidyltransferase substrate binding domain-containing protein [Actinomycetota bacterium]|nr:putative nucleotidyltransferase substrate binding domain-containing protein [Actinomycetota bacterium]